MKMIYTLVGMQYRDSKELVAKMQRGTGLALRRNPENPHDPFAVEVWYEGKHIAFVKATEVRELAGMMDRGGYKEINGIFTTGGDRWPQVEVDIR